MNEKCTHVIGGINFFLILINLIYFGYILLPLLVAPYDALTAKKKRCGNFRRKIDPVDALFNDQQGIQ